MPFVDITSDKHAIYGTHSHGEEGFATPGGQYPAQLKWSDLHPPGVKVLPKGSPPAGPGEINWENTLGGKFALALAKLEGLLYAVFGSRPDAIPDGEGGWIKRQWYDRLHPRCLWGPETWQRRLIYLPGWGCFQHGQCWDYEPFGKEYPALGESPPCCPMSPPSVPIRSRSGDPADQFATAPHNEAFPVGSVTRSHGESYPYDPEGSGWFGSTQPGRQDGVGYYKFAGEVETFTWTKPPDLPIPSVVEIAWQTRMPGEEWPLQMWQVKSLEGGPDVYSTTLGPYAHGTQCRWYLRARRTSSPVYDYYDPDGEPWTGDPTPYYLSWFTHYNPYAHGLPEMLDNYGGVDIRHGTDFYEFDGSETVQPALLNMVRFVLSWLGSNCCHGQYDTCAETDYRSGAIHHNPRTRPSEPSDLCCVDMPIRFHWSGSNQHPHYRTGGKGLVGGSTPDPRPLHNHPNHMPGQGETWGSSAARKTWRGIDMLYMHSAHFDNPRYGGGTSWGVAPGTFILHYMPNWSQYAEVWAKYPEWGLRDGDVIEAVHIQEIIDAVDYLIDYGVWTKVNVYSQPRTPTLRMAHWDFAGDQSECMAQGEIWDRSDTTCDPRWDKFYKQCHGMCCEECEQILAYGEVYKNGQLMSAMGDWPICTAFSPPTLEECVNLAQHAVCRLSWQFSRGVSLDTCGFASWGGFDVYAAQPSSSVSITGSGLWSATCNPWVIGKGVAVQGYGFSAYFCTPPPCHAGGWDENHGVRFGKERMGHEWTGNLSPVATGPLGGNCLGDLYACGLVWPVEGFENIWFSQVVGAELHTPVYPAWFLWRRYTIGDASPRCDVSAIFELQPPVPGLGWHDLDGDPLCTAEWECWEIDGGIFCEGARIGSFAQQHLVCAGEAVWGAVDLNLDGSGYPYRHFHGHYGQLPSYKGIGIPFLRPYDLDKDPLTWMHTCPCETWTGEIYCPG